MSGHSARGHAQWSASATARNWTCPGAIALSTVAPPEKPSIHAATGTAVHELAETCLRESREPMEWLGETIDIDGQAILIGPEEVDSAGVYVDHVRSIPGVLLLEQSFSLAALNPPFEAGGTCDAIRVERQRLTVIDLKNGRGVVEAFENKQLRTYALAAFLNLDKDALRDVDEIRVEIVQPRAPHKDGVIRGETFDIASLIDWTSDLLKAMRRSKRALDEFQAVGGNSVKMDEWSEAWLNPGACKFCPAEGFCPKLKKEALRVAGVWFDDLDAQQIANQPALQSPEALAKTLDGLDMLEDWIAATRAHAHARAERGETIPGYQLADKIGNRAWKTGHAETAGLLHDKLSLNSVDIFEQPKLKSVAQIEKVLGSKRKKDLEALEGVLWERPIKGTNLVSVSKTTRPPAKSKVDQHFEKLEK